MRDMSEPDQEKRDKDLEKATRRMIEEERKRAELYLGPPGSQSRGRPPRKSAVSGD